jgi:hypothetical protein
MVGSVAGPVGRVVELSIPAQDHRAHSRSY